MFSVEKGKAGSAPLVGWWLCGLVSSWQLASSATVDSVCPDFGSVVCVLVNLWLPHKPLVVSAIPGSV